MVQFNFTFLHLEAINFQLTDWNLGFKWLSDENLVQIAQQGNKIQTKVGTTLFIIPKKLDSYNMLTKLLEDIG